MVVPFLGLEPLVLPPDFRLVSEAEAIQLLWGQVDSSFKGFRGIASVCCKLVSRKGICQGPQGCSNRESPCLLKNVKKWWLEAGFPVFDRDDKIIEKLSVLKAKFDKQRKNPRIKEAQKEQIVNIMKSTTFNIAPLDWEKRIREDRFLTKEANITRTNILQDYIGEEASRTAKVMP